MHLKGLSRRGAQGSITEAVGQVIHGQEQLGRDATGRTAQAQHHLPGLVLSFLPFIAVILLVAPVELQQLKGIFTEEGKIVREFIQQGVPQVMTVELALLSLRQPGRG